MPEVPLPCYSGKVLPFIIPMGKAVCGSIFFVIKDKRTAEIKVEHPSLYVP